jgi:hypothetical protein
VASLGGCNRHQFYKINIVSVNWAHLNCMTKWGANGAAHGLVKEATPCYSDKIWLEETPSCISHIMSLKFSALSL